MEHIGQELESQYEITFGSKVLLRFGDPVQSVIPPMPMERSLQSVRPVFATGGKVIPRKNNFNSIGWTVYRQMLTVWEAEAARVKAMASVPDTMEDVTVRYRHMGGTVTLKNAAITAHVGSVNDEDTYLRIDYTIKGGELIDALAPFALLGDGLVQYAGSRYAALIADMPGGSPTDWITPGNYLSDAARGGVRVETSTDTLFFPLIDTGIEGAEGTLVDAAEYSATLGGLRLTLGSDHYFIPLTALPD